jgi:hypothetical protein
VRARRVIILVVVLAVAGALCITNPRRDEYVEWAIQKAQPGSGHYIGRVIHPETAPMYIDGATVWRNYGLFSLFYTEAETGDVLVTLGLCKQYIPLRGSRAGDGR